MRLQKKVDATKSSLFIQLISKMEARRRDSHSKFE
jgi:hypothetical protein